MARRKKKQAQSPPKRRGFLNFGRDTATQLGRSPHRRPLRVESLEDRRLLALLTVTTLEDSVNINDGVTSLREAIFAANIVPGADTIEFAPALMASGPATILLKQGELKITESLTIDGPGSEWLTIDASGSDPTPDTSSGDGSRVFHINDGIRFHFAQVSLSSLSIVGGDVVGNGGGILNEEWLVARDCTFAANSASMFGGAVYNARIFSLDGCVFDGNTSSLGGGLANFGAMDMTRTVVANNKAIGVDASTNAAGGGIFSNGNLGVTHSRISGNLTNGSGGGIHAAVAYDRVVITNSVISGNTAADEGGGLRLFNMLLTLDNSTVSGNSAARGAGVHIRGGAATIDSTTITRNRSQVDGGGVWFGGALRDHYRQELRHTIIAGNTSAGDGAPDLRQDVWRGTIDISYSLIGDATQSGLVEAVGGLPDVNGNLIGGLVHGVIDPMLGPLADNGGFELPDGSHILAHALLPGSPAINAGDLNAVAGQGGVPLDDQRGEPFGRIVGGRIDIGAFEYQTPTDLNLLVDTLVDESDGDYSRGDLSLREAIELANANNHDGVIDTIHFDPALWATRPATIVLSQGELGITDELTIEGPGASQLTIFAQRQSRIFNITATTGDFRIAGLALTGGRVVGAGGGVEDTSLSGGAIRSLTSGTLIVDQCAIRGGEVTASLARGGGIFALGPVELRDSVLSGNRAVAGAGGGIYSTQSVLLHKSTLTESIALSGGGVFAKGAVSSYQSTVQRSVLTGVSQRGGGIASLSDVSLVDSVVKENSAGRGGGVFSKGAVTLTRSIVSGNRSGSGGGVLSYGHATIVESVIRNNEASNGTLPVVSGPLNFPADYTFVGGGGVLAMGDVRIERSWVDTNKAVGLGGGISGFESVTVVESTVSNNSVTGPLSNLVAGGGGIVGEAIIVENSTISGNFAPFGGGLNAYGPLTVSHSTITKNFSPTSGAGIRAWAGGTISHSIVAANSARGGSDIQWLAVSAGPPSPPVVVEFSLISSNRGNGLVEAPVGAPDANGNLIGGPVHGVISPQLGPLADNGGFELPDGSRLLTHALLSESPAINAGDLNAVAGEAGIPAFDERGVSFGRIVGGRIDFGAFEYQTPTDLNLLVDTLVDESDGDYSRGDLSLREAIELANASKHDGVVDTIRFDPTLWAAAPATILLTHGELKITDALVIDGPGAALLTVDASGNDPTPDVNDGRGTRVLTFDDGNIHTTNTNTVSGLTLTGGDLWGDRFGNGGGVLTKESLTIASCTISGNSIVADSGGYGGGIFAGQWEGSSLIELTIRDSTISGNRASRSGGGIATSGALLRVIGSTVQYNSAQFGGGLSAIDGMLVLTSTTVYYNTASSGGGIQRRGGQTTIASSTIAGNSASSGSGGGILSLVGSLDLHEVGIYHNSAKIDGGGVHSDRSNVVVIDSNISSNYAGQNGGGISNSNGTLTVEASTISGNSAHESGGGICGNSLSVVGSTISGNYADGRGGGIYCRDGVLSISACTVSGNFSLSDGGGVYLRSFREDSGAICCSTISGNFASTGAGLFLVVYNQANFAIRTTTITGNSAYMLGGGAFVVGGHIAVEHSVVANNGALFGYDLTQIPGTDLQLRYSLIGDNANSGLVEAPVGMPDANGNLIGGPMYGVIDPLLGALANNGGPTMTHALLPGSPAINAGSPGARADFEGTPAHDQRGAPFTRVYGGRIDIGAVERIPSGLLPGDYNLDGLVNAADFTVWRDVRGTHGDTTADGNGDGVVDGADYTVWKNNLGTEFADLGGSGQGQVFAAVDEWSAGSGNEKPPAEPGAELSTRLQAEHTRQPPALPGVNGVRPRPVADEFARHDVALEAWWASRGRPVRVTRADSWDRDGYEPESEDAFECAIAELGQLKLAIHI